MSEIIGYQVINDNEQYYNDRPSHEVIMRDTAIYEYKKAYQQSPKTNWRIQVVLAGDIEDPSFEVNPSNLTEILGYVDAIEIDDCFIRHFNYQSHSDDYDDLDFVMLEAGMVDEEYNKYEWMLHKSELDNAIYNQQKNAWSIGDTQIKVFYLQPVV